MGMHDALINKLWANESDRKIARAFAEKFGDVPGMEDRIAPLLQEASRGDAMVRDGTRTREEAQAYLLSFATEALGTPVHLTQEFQNWQPDASLLPPEPPDAEQPQQPAGQPAPTQPVAAAASAQTTNADARIAEIKSMMGAPHGSDAWRGYWMGDAGAKVQAEYRELLEPKSAGTETQENPDVHHAV